MDRAQPFALAGSWQARLELEYSRRGERTILDARRHDGPLVVQKPLYPDDDDACHTIVVHPPGGIAGGDELALHARGASDARVLFTTPGAGKWYRSTGAWASQSLAFDVGAGGAMEWLPQETILFSGSRAKLVTDIRLAGDAVFLGWESLCFGRTGSGERYGAGECRVSTTISREGRLLWAERSKYAAGDDLLQSPAALAGQSVYGTFYAAAEGMGRELVDGLRSVAPVSGKGAVTLLPGVLVCRYLGDSSESARLYFKELWRRLRPAIAGRAAAEPRIWRT